MKDLIAKFKIYGFKRFIIFSLMRLYRKIWLETILHTYSQRGEDKVIYKILNKKEKGFYVDIGSYDPVTFSNTKYFYDKGWNGINIEPDLNNFKKFLKERKLDLNLNVGVGNQTGLLTFYQFVPNTLSTFSSEEAKKYQKLGYTISSKRKVKVEKLSSLLKGYAKNKKIDLLSIDTEGFDLEVLKGNDWSRFRPRVVCVESVEHKVVGSGPDTNLNKFFEKVDYNKYLDNGINCIYIDGKN